MSALSFAAGMLIVVLAVGIVYMLLPKRQQAVEAKKKPPVLQDTMHDISLFSGEHFYKIHHHRHIDRDAEPVVLLTDEEQMLENGKLNARQKRLLELLPNAPVIYLYDFKITDYTNLYFKEDGNAEIINDTAASKFLSLAMKNFLEKRFDESHAALAHLLALENNDPNALFYSGLCYYYTKEYEKAIVLLSSIRQLTNNVFKQEAAWYKMLCLENMNKKQEAKTMCTEIAAEQGFYAAKAKEKLKGL